MFCHSCGKEIQEGLKFCPECGANLQLSDKPDIKPKVRKKIKLKYILIIFLFVIWGFFMFIYITPVKAGSIHLSLMEFGFSLNKKARIEYEKKQINLFLKNIDEILDKWEPTEKLASSTPRMALSGPISELASIRKKMDELKPPKVECKSLNKLYLCTQLKDLYLEQMDHTLKSYYAFISDWKDDSKASAEMIQASTSKQKAATLREEINK